MTGQPLRESEREKERARQRDERNKACDQPTSLRQPVAWAGWAAKSPAPISFLCRKVCDSDAPPFQAIPPPYLRFPYPASSSAAFPVARPDPRWFEYGFEGFSIQ